MIDLDTSNLPGEVANVLMLRGAELPPVQWQLRPNQAAKEILDLAVEDTALLRQKHLADEAMGAAVRASLYLWNGWLADCGMYAQGAPDRERDYLCSLCARHAGNATEAKAFLQQIEQHPIWEPLAEFALETIGLGADPQLGRLKKIIQLGEAWEPFSFLDLYEQARAGKLCQATEQIVRQIQCREFELLFVHCYEAASGQVLPKHRKTNRDPQRPRKPTPKRPPAKRPIPPRATTDGKPGATTVTLLKPGIPRVGVRCPKCDHLLALPESHRGRKQECPQCHVVFLVPRKTDAAAAPRTDA